jgi:polyhydroxyalkanoate synthesis regulator phasin
MNKAKQREDDRMRENRREQGLIQYVTQEQFEQLTEKQHLLYVNWVVGQMVKEGDYTKAHRSAHDLIQFIDEHITDQWLMEHNKKRNLWRVRARFSTLYTEQTELIDALWEAVKILTEQIPLQGEGVINSD